MAKVNITQTNGASAQDISEAIGRFLAQLEEDAVMFCDEPIKKVYFGSQDSLDGAADYFDHYHDLAYHVTEGCRMALETEHWVISLDVNGVRKEPKSALNDIADEVLDPDDEPFDGFETTLFVGQRLRTVRKDGDIYLAEFDDLTVKIIPYALGTMNKTVRKNDHWSYLPARGCEHHLKRTCDCGGEGEILLDFVWDYVVRCKNCKRSTYADMQLKTAIESWNNGELPCRLEGIVIE